MSDRPTTSESPVILIVDDEETIRTSMELILSAEGFTVHTAGTASEAKAFLSARSADLVISDIRLPDLDGTNLLAWVRNEGLSVPVVMITGMPGRDTVESAVAKEASGYLVKPIRRVDLLEAIGRALYRRVRLEDDPELVAAISRRFPHGEDTGGSRTLLNTLAPEDLEAVLDGLVPFCLTDEAGVIVAANRPFESLTRLSAEELTGTDLRALLGREQDIYHFSSAQARDRARRTEMTLRRAGSGTVQVDVVISPLGRVSGDHRFIFSARDLTDYNRKKDHLEYLAYHDPLTGLLNRSGFERALKTELGRARELNSGLAVMYLDLDGFRDVTERFGHAAGDALLRKVAQAMTSIGGDRVMLGRLSGDMFMAAVRDVGTAREAEEVASDLQEAVGHLTKGDFLETRITSCVGITLFPEQGEDVDRLLGNADSARTRAKKKGKGKTCLYEARFTEQLHETLQMEDDLYRALRDGSLRVYYQPIVDAKTHRVAAVEALVRQANTDGTLRSPLTFIPVAESSGLIVPIGEWILRQAATDAARMRESSGEQFRVAVNVSALQLEQGNLEQVLPGILKESGLAASDLELEITESVMLDMAGKALGTLASLRELGIGISMDDFGTGFSSLTYLRDYPVNRIKVDRTFVRHIATSAVDASIARAVNDLARGLGIATIGEGVETKEQAQLLYELGCHELQGFLFSPALSPDALLQFLAAQKSDGPATLN